MRTAERVCVAVLALGVIAPVRMLEAAPGRRISVTIDDLPFVDRGLPLREVKERTRKLLATLKKYRVPAIGFVNEDKLLVRREVDARIALLDDWLDAGMDLGNHTFGHVGFQRTPLAEYQERVIRGDTVTRWLLGKRGRKPRFFRHPFTQTGPTEADKRALEAFLGNQGYRVAPFTIEHDDFVFDLAYCADIDGGRIRAAAEAKTAYVAHLAKALDVYESMAMELFGREIPQVLLIHANRINADSLDEMLSSLEKRGYTFVSLDDALADPAYTSPDGYIGPTGPSWLLRWSKGLKKPTTKQGAPEVPEPVASRYRALLEGR